MRIRHLKNIVRFLVIAWPASVLAATMTFGQAVGQIERVEVILVFLLSTLAGVTSFLISYSRRINDTPIDADLPPIRNFPLLVGAHMTGSLLAGIVAFFFAAHWMPGLLIGFFVPAMAFGGAKALAGFFSAASSKIPGFTPSKE